LFLIFSSKTTRPIGTKLEEMFIGLSSKKHIMSLVNWKYTEKTRGPKVSKGYFMFLIFFSKTLGTKLGMNVHWMVL
jgi:hypothetical protein